MLYSTCLRNTNQPTKATASSSDGRNHSLCRCNANTHRPAASTQTNIHRLPPAIPSLPRYPPCARRAMAVAFDSGRLHQQQTPPTRHEKSILKGGTIVPPSRARTRVLQLVLLRIALSPLCIRWSTPSHFLLAIGGTNRTHTEHPPSPSPNAPQKISLDGGTIVPPSRASGHASSNWRCCGPHPRSPLCTRWGSRRTCLR